MAKHIFLVAAVALVVLVQQHDAGAITVKDKQSILSIVDEYITKATYALNSSVNFEEVEQNFNSKYLILENFFNALNYKYYFIHMDLLAKTTITEENLNPCKKELEMHLETDKNLGKLNENCVVPLLDIMHSNIPEIRDIIKNLDKNNKLAALKKENEICKSYEDPADVLHCGTKIVLEAIDLSKKTTELKMKIQQVDDQLDSMFAKMDLCYFTNSISALGKEYYANVVSLNNCMISHKIVGPYNIDEIDENE